MLTRLGPYRLLRKVGDGGTGTVYEAERDDGQFTQRVAIKILRPEIAQTRRFERERRILAQLQHPYIANLIDGGAVDGIPYIVMEYVEGVPIDQYAAEHNLNLRERLDLFLLVCQGVQHAHSALIVHRDLRPANILVKAEGVPKLLDFGMAKEHGSAMTMVIPLATRFTSPEQVAGEPVTTVSDVYSLGILLAVLIEGISGAGDLNNIIGMATRPEPHRRYGSAAQLAEDIERFLDGHMVIARPDTIAYRCSKFARRNRVPLGLASLLLMVLFASAFFVYREGRRAQRRFDEAHGLLSSVLNEVDSEAGPVIGSAKLRRMMVEKSLTYLNRLVEESGGDRKLLVELARAYHQVGDIQGHRRYQNLGQYNESLESHLHGIRIEERLLKSDPGNATLRNQLAWGYGHIAELHSYRGDSEKATTYAMLAKSYLSQSDPDNYVDTSISISRVLHFEGRTDEALRMLQDALKVANPTSAPKLATLLKWAAEEAHYLGRVPLALEYTNTAISLLEKLPLQGNDITRLLVARRDRGVQLSQAASPNEERHCEAIADLQYAVDGQSEVFAQDPKSINRMIQVVTALQMLSASQSLCGKREAIAMAQRAIEVFNRDKKRYNPDLEWHLAFAHLRLGQIAEADRVLATIEKPDANILELKGEIAIARNRMEDARRLLAAARAARQPELKAKNFEQLFVNYRQAANIRLALRAGDTTPGLRQQALDLLAPFPETGVARSIVRLRSELKQ